MSGALDRYRELETRLWLTRFLHGVGASPIEDDLTDEMERLWWLLDDGVRQKLDAEGPRCWPDLPSPKNPKADSVELDPVEQVGTPARKAA